MIKKIIQAPWYQDVRYYSGWSNRRIAFGCALSAATFVAALVAQII